MFNDFQPTSLYVVVNMTIKLTVKGSGSLDAHLHVISNILVNTLS